jgi:DNA-binding LytR/AlgR family response regulator
MSTNKAIEKIRAIIIDDEPEAITSLKILLEDYDEIEVVGEANGVDDGIAVLLDNRADIVLLDIQMPEKNGFELLHELQKYKLNPAVIFTTAFDQFAIEAIRHSAFDYLLKPIDPMELKKSIRRYQSKHDPNTVMVGIHKLLEMNPNQKLRFATRTGSIFIHPDEIIYIQAEGNYSELFLIGEKRQMVTMYLKDIFDQIPASGFQRLGRSVVINMKYLKKVDRKKRICFLEYKDSQYEIRTPSKYLRELEI